jgi:hypothetical protein
VNYPKAYRSRFRKIWILSLIRIRGATESPERPHPRGGRGSGLLARKMVTGMVRLRALSKTPALQSSGSDVEVMPFMP